MALICALLICARLHIFWTLGVLFGAALILWSSISTSDWVTIAFAIFASRIKFSLNPVFKCWYFFSAPLITIGSIYLLKGSSRTSNVFSGRPLIWEFWVDTAFLPHWLFGIGPKASHTHQEIYQKALEHQIETGATIPAFHSIFINTLATTGLTGTILIYCVFFIRYLKVNNFIANFLFLAIWPSVHFQNFSQILGTSPTTLILLASIFLGASSSKNAFTRKS